MDKMKKALESVVWSVKGFISGRLWEIREPVLVRVVYARGSQPCQLVFARFPGIRPASRGLGKTQHDLHPYWLDTEQIHDEPWLFRSSSGGRKPRCCKKRHLLPLLVMHSLA